MVLISSPDTMLMYPATSPMLGQNWIPSSNITLTLKMGLAIPVNGPGELLEGPLDVEPEGLFYHVVHLVCVGHPVCVHITTVLTKDLQKIRKFQARTEIMNLSYYNLS